MKNGPAFQCGVLLASYNHLIGPAKITGPPLVVHCVAKAKFQHNIAPVLIWYRVGEAPSLSLAGEDASTNTPISPNSVLELSHRRGRT